MPTSQGNYSARAAQDAELLLILPKSMAPWDAANRVAQFIDAWLESALLERGAHTEDLNYVVNELMENAVKYAADGSIELSVGFEPQRLRVSLSHLAAAQNAARYQQLALELATRDPDALFAEVIERNALSELPVQNGAGLGLITLRQNYQAELGFAFQAIDPLISQVSTQVCLPWPVSAQSNISSHLQELRP
jgi:hypothetical protein